MIASRAELVAEARTWKGTPYKHQASIKGVGCDCLGLIRGVWRRFYGPEPQLIHPYTRWWAEELGQETMKEAADQWLIPIDAQPYRQDTPFRDGDVVLMRMRRDGPAKHAAITVAPNKLIHAYSPHPVKESPANQFRTKIAYAYEFPPWQP